MSIYRYIVISPAWRQVTPMSCKLKYVLQNTGIEVPINTSRNSRTNVLFHYILISRNKHKPRSWYVKSCFILSICCCCWHAIRHHFTFLNGIASELSFLILLLFIIGHLMKFIHLLGIACSFRCLFLKCFPLSGILTQFHKDWWQKPRAA